jgi:DNA polymerase delta subunit 2
MPINVERYYSEDGSDQLMLEDDSGRIRLVGDILPSIHIVTGCIIAVMGTENADGEFEVIDVKFPDLAPQPDRWNLSKPPSNKVKDEDEDMTGSQPTRSNNKIAIVSGLGFSGQGSSYGTELNLLLEFLLGEALDPSLKSDITQISRLIIAGNSISASKLLQEPSADKKAHKKYGYDASAYNATPSQLFDDFLVELLPSIPVTLLPGAQDPANAAYPQQPIHPAMFPRSREFASESPSQSGWFDTVTNPWEAEVEGWRILGTGGQNVDDVFKYVDSDDRLGMMEAMCRWRCSAPTAPDTLCK